MAGVTRNGYVEKGFLSAAAHRTGPLDYGTVVCTMDSSVGVRVWLTNAVLCDPAVAWSIPSGPLLIRAS